MIEGNIQHLFPADLPRWPCYEDSKRRYQDLRSFLLVETMIPYKQHAYIQIVRVFVLVWGRGGRPGRQSTSPPLTGTAPSCGDSEMPGFGRWEAPHPQVR